MTASKDRDTRVKLAEEKRAKLEQELKEYDNSVETRERRKSIRLEERALAKLNQKERRSTDSLEARLESAIEAELDAKATCRQCGHVCYSRGVNGYSGHRQEGSTICDSCSDWNSQPEDYS